MISAVIRGTFYRELLIFRAEKLCANPQHFCPQINFSSYLRIIFPQMSNSQLDVLAFLRCACGIIVERTKTAESIESRLGVRF
jgi:hypothetical protein